MEVKSLLPPALKTAVLIEEPGGAYALKLNGLTVRLQLLSLEQAVTMALDMVGACCVSRLQQIC